MGSRSGCAIFKAFSEPIQYLAEAKGCGKMSHVLDDFLMVSRDSSMSADSLKIFLDLCEQLGIPVVLDKMESGAFA